LSVAHFGQCADKSIKRGFIAVYFFRPVFRFGFDFFNCMTFSMRRSKSARIGEIITVIIEP
jgi:hypothetical protein